MVMHMVLVNVTLTDTYTYTAALSSHLHKHTHGNTLRGCWALLWWLSIIKWPASSPNALLTTVIYSHGSKGGQIRQGSPENIFFLKVWKNSKDNVRRGLQLTLVFFIFLMDLLITFSINCLVICTFKHKTLGFTTTLYNWILDFTDCEILGFIS